MEQINYVKSFSRGQITIPKTVRQAVGLGDNFWLKLIVQNGRVIAEPVEGESSAPSDTYLKDLLKIKGKWLSPLEVKELRTEVRRRLRKLAV